jgi:hypothetical protein
MSLRGAQRRGNLVVCKAVMHWRRDCHAIARNDMVVLVVARLQPSDNYYKASGRIKILNKQTYILFLLLFVNR